MTAPRRILILGVTASGKARLAFDLALHLRGEIVSVDSMKVYRRMNIGTAKPSQALQARVPHALIDIVEPSESYDVATFYADAQQALERIEARNRPAILVGGTALYIKALIYGIFAGPGADDGIRRQLSARVEREGLPSLYLELQRVDPAAAARIAAPDRRRILRALEVYQLTGRPISSLQTQFDADTAPGEWTVIGLRRDKATESRRINGRVKAMMEAGLIEEVRSLLLERPPLGRQARAAIGYREVIDHLEGRTDLEETVERIKINTRRLAKGQRTWFKTFPFVRWLELNEASSAEEALERTLAMLDEGEGVRL